MNPSAMNPRAMNLIASKTTRCCALAAGVLLAWQANAARLQLEPGTQQTVAAAAAIERIAVGDPEVAGINAAGTRSVLVTAKKYGRTTLLVWEKGRSEPVRHEVIVEPRGLALQTSLGIADLGDARLVSGLASSLEEHAATRALAADKSPPVDTSKSVFDSQVQIDIKIVEVSRSRMMSAGFAFERAWNGNRLTLSSPGVAVSAAGVSASPNAFNMLFESMGDNFLSALSVLESNGYAYTLATPSLSVMSGQSASFLAGGELPIPTRAGGSEESGISIQYREFGVKLQVAATVLDQNRIALKVAPEVSEPDPTLGVSTAGVTVPGFVVRKSETTLMLGDGESFVIGGLFSRNVQNAVDKFPGLGDLPVIGAFFRSKNFDSSDKELLMVVSAHLVKPMAAGAELPPLPGEQYRAYNPGYGEYLFEAAVVGERRLPVGVSE